MRLVTTAQLRVAWVLFASLPVLANAALYKCVDEKTKAVTYGGTPCISSTQSKPSIVDNAIIDGAAAQRKIAPRRMEEQRSGPAGTAS